MTSTLRPRGPDDSGTLVSKCVGLGHTRLSIQDLSSAGHQPMLDQSGRFAIVFNGEVYNFRELRRQLEATGLTFRSASDTEVVLQAYITWGTDAFSKLDGMFAIALWDDLQQQLHLVRDRFGIKPLYYYSDSERLIFGSEIKALLAAGNVPRALDWAGLREYLHYGTTLGERTMFADIRRLLPGHLLTIDVKGLQIRPYTSIHDVAPVEDDYVAATHRVRTLLEQSVQSHLISDVPVGVFLSGGIDSASLTAFASRRYRGKLQTFSAGFDFDSGVSELSQARAIANYFGTEHHELHIRGRNLPDVLEKVAQCHDVPFADAANIPLYLLCLELQGTIKVVLQGDGGDEMFGGYARYSRLGRQHFWRWLGPVVELARPFLPHRGSIYRGLRTLAALRNADPELHMALLMSQEPPDQPPERVFSAEAQRRLFTEDPFQRYREQYRKLKHLDPVQRMLHTDAAIILPDTYLEKVDKSTMAHGIEVRVPFLDNNLARYAMGLPASYKATPRDKKRVLRQALRGVVPDFVLDSPKRGFGVPMSNWLRKPLAEFLQSVLLDDSSRASGLFEVKELSRCIREHLSGHRDHGFLLYKLLQFNLWYRKYLAVADHSTLNVNQAA